MSTVAVSAPNDVSGHVNCVARQEAEPQPPSENRDEQHRPEFLLKNSGSDSLTVFWIRDDGGETEIAVVPPGEQKPITSTLGHQFRVKGDDGFSDSFEVTKQQETFEFDTSMSGEGQSAPDANGTTGLTREKIAELIRNKDPQVAVDGYESRNIEGWPVRISNILLDEHPELTARAVELLAEQLRLIREVLPAAPLAHVENVPLWLSPPYPGIRPTAEYHPGAQWLAEQQRRPELFQCVEFTNIGNFEQEIVRMPVMTLHELAHAYHDQVLDFENVEVRTAFENARTSGIYDAVERSNGSTERAYAMTNPMEYFAESSEAYFGVNDFYPYRKSELEEHDPEMARLLKRLWRVEDR